MANVILCYDFSAEHTSQAAGAIGEKLSYIYNVKVLDIFEAVPNSFTPGDVVISVVSTWHDGSLPPAWNQSVPMLRTVSFAGKKVAFCGLGNADEYPGFFCNAIGTLADLFELGGGTLIGMTPSADYKFSESTARRGQWMVGLCLDYQKHRDRIPDMVGEWCAELKKQID